MFPGTVAVKKTALASLKDEWPAIMAVTVIPLGFYLISVNVFALFGYWFSDSEILYEILCTVFAFSFVFIGIPLLFGFMRIMWNLLNGISFNIAEIFYYFSSFKIYKRTFNFILLFLVRIIIKAFLFFLPSYILDYIINSFSLIFSDTAMPLWLDNIWVFSVLLRVIAIICIIYTVLRYYMAPFLFVTNENAEPIECVNKAPEISKISMGAYVTLLFSLTGWILLSAFFVPLLFTVPYMCMCYVVHSRYSVVFYNEKAKKPMGFGL